MFKSLQSFVNKNLTVVKPGETNAMGDYVDGEKLEGKCYPAYEMKTIVDKFGEETVSGTQLYLLQPLQIGHRDKVILDDTEYSIKAVSTYLWTGEEVQVIYL